MAGTRQTNTFGEALQKMLPEYAMMKTLPDADIPWIINQETGVIAKIREPIDGPAANGTSQVPGDPSLGMAIGAQGQNPTPDMMGMGAGDPNSAGPGNMTPPISPSLGANPGGGVPGVNSMPGSAMPSNPDELRRILGQS